MYIHHLFTIIISVSLISAFPAPTSTLTSILTNSLTTRNKNNNNNNNNLNIIKERDYQPGEIPNFPSNIPSCVVCEPKWSSINSCASAAIAFQSFSSMILDPANFANEIKCGCTDTFQSAYPQCVDCFVQTNQCPQYLGVPSQSGANSIIDGIRNVCGLGSALLGGVAASATRNNATYTYTGVPSQGYPTSTYIGPGGIDLGSSEGSTKSVAGRNRGLANWSILGCTFLIGLGMILV